MNSTTVFDAQDADRAALFGRLSFSTRTLSLSLFGWLALQQLLLWRFLGYASPLGWIAFAAAFSALGVGLYRAKGWDRASVSPKVFGVCLAVAIAVFVLGGEGRFVYANTDWQVRDAVLRDLTLYPWPFAYDLSPARMLRLPLGMYLPPAAIGKLLGYRAAELALLAQNSLMFATLLSIGATLFQGARNRLIALGVFLGFSGMDLIGAFLTHHALTGHVEAWAGLQFSSHITQAFWVPQHGMAGWIGALLYLLWREERAPLSAFLASVPLIALFSPLALMGLIPFALHAGLDGLLRRKLGLGDIVLPGLALIIAVPSLLYLTAAGDSVGGGMVHIDPLLYVVFELVEIGPIALALLLLGSSRRFGSMTFAVALGMLLLAPLGQVGHAVDFTMRASIPALAIFAVMMADLLTRKAVNDRMGAAKRIALTGFVIGLWTPAMELKRALIEPASPAPLCSYLGVVPGGAATYVASLDRVPALIRPHNPTLIKPADPKTCWAGPWPDPVIIS